MTPVAGRISDRYEDEFIFFPGFFPGFIRPGVPVYGVFGVLLQIEAGFASEVVSGVIGHGQAGGRKGEQTQANKLLFSFNYHFEHRKSFNWVIPRQENSHIPRYFSILTEFQT
jgi:hypothetical protein